MLRIALVLFITVVTIVGLVYLYQHVTDSDPVTQVENVSTSAAAEVVDSDPVTQVEDVSTSAAAEGAGSGPVTQVEDVSTSDAAGGAGSGPAILQGSDESMEISAPLNSMNSELTTLDKFFNPLVLSMLVGLVFVLALGLLVVCIMLLKLLRWRQRHLSSETVVLQDAYIDFIEGLKKAWASLQEDLASHTKATLSSYRENSASIDELKTSIVKLNSVIDDQQREIVRYREGYDFAIKKNTMFAFVELKELVNSLVSEEPDDVTVRQLDKVSAYVDSFFDEFEIEEFSAPKGDSTREEAWRGSFEIIDSEFSTSEELIDTFIETVRVGYSFGYGAERTILRKAKVKAYIRGED